MKAWLSALSGRALLQHTPEQFALCELGHEALLPLTQTQAWQHWRMRQDWEEHQVASADALRELLTHKARQQRALDMALMSLDATLSDGLRREVLAALNVELAYPELARWLDDLFSLRPLPANTNISAALVLADATPRAQAWLHQRQQGQAGASKLWANWGQLHTVLAEDAQDALRLRLLGSGLLADIANKLGQNQGSHLLFTLPSALQGLGVANSRAVAQVLCHENRSRQQTAQTADRDADADEISSSQLAAKKTHQRKNKPARKPQTAKPRAIDRDAVRVSVEKQKIYILAQLHEQRPDKAEHSVKELIEYQLNNGHASHLAKSLSDLATQAKAHGYLQQALHWSEQALFYASDDVIAKNVRAEALRSLGRFDDALAAYQTVIAEHPQNVVARNGHAETLRSLGRFDDALAAYQTVIAEHPQNVVAKTGHAETLRSLGRFDDALAAYQTVIAKHPQDVVARNGHAETLRSLGRFDDALAAYQTVIAKHPQDVVAKTGHAETLRSLGRFDDALAAYQTVIAEHPQNVVARNGHAETLRSLGRFDDALAAYQTVIAEHPQDVVARNGHAETLRSLGRFDDALAAYQTVIAEHPQNVVARNGYAETLRSLGRFDDALAAYQMVIAEHPQDVVARNGHAETLRSLGRFDDALAAYQTVIAEHPQDVVARNGHAETLRSLGRFDDALAAYQDTAQAFPHDAYAQAGVAMLHLLLGEPEQALRQLPESSPQAQAGWVAWHIRGMALLRLQRWQDAKQVFEQGVESAPWAQRQAFAHGLTLLKLWHAPSEPDRQTVLATSALPDWQHRVDTPPGKSAWLLCLHELALLHEAEAAQKLQQQAAQILLLPIWRSTATELVSRARQQGQHHDAWLLEREIDCLLLAA